MKVIITKRLWKILNNLLKEFFARLCFAQKILTTATWSAISIVPRAKRLDLALQLTN
jgi:hypothetical protein